MRSFLPHPHQRGPITRTRTMEGVPWLRGTTSYPNPTCIDCFLSLAAWFPLSRCLVSSVSLLGFLCQYHGLLLPLHHLPNESLLPFVTVEPLRPILCATTKLPGLRGTRLLECPAPPYCTLYKKRDTPKTGVESRKGMIV